MVYEITPASQVAGPSHTTIFLSRKSVEIRSDSSFKRWTVLLCVGLDAGGHTLKWIFYIIFRSTPNRLFAAMHSKFSLGARAMSQAYTRGDCAAKHWWSRSPHLFDHSGRLPIPKVMAVQTSHVVALILCIWLTHCRGSCAEMGPCDCTSLPTN